MRLFGADELEQVRAAVASDLGALADEVAGLEHAVEPDERARELYLAATANYAHAERALGELEHPQDAAAATAAIHEGRTRMAAARARLEKRARPAELPPCFFDPGHGPAAQLVAWLPKGLDGRTVPACADCVQLILDDRDPEPRRIPCGHRLRVYWELDHLAGWFVGYFGGRDDCSVTDLLAGLPLADAFAPAAGDDGVITAEEVWAAKAPPP